MGQKVIIYAYCNFNLGDDLFIKILCDRYPKTQFYLYAPKRYKDLFKSVTNLKIYPSNRLFIRGVNYISRKLGKNTYYFRSMIAKKCDAAVYIGGSLFMQHEDWKRQYENKQSMKIYNKPFYLLGANFGPYKDEEFYNKYRNMFLDYTDICFRDSYSYDLFKDLSNVRLADDIIFQLNTNKIIPKIKTKNVVISVIKPSDRKDLANYDDIYYKKIREITIYLNEKGYNVVFISFCESQGDEEAIEEITKLLPIKHQEKINKHYYKDNIEETINIISNSDFVVATRFHSMILGWVFNKPVFPIAYSKKMTNVIEDLDFQGGYTDFNELDKLDPSDVYRSKESNLIDISEQVKKSESQFEKLDEFLS